MSPIKFTMIVWVKVHKLSIPISAGNKAQNDLSGKQSLVLKKKNFKKILNTLRPNVLLSTILSSGNKKSDKD